MIRPRQEIRWPLFILTLAVLFAGVTGWSIRRAYTGTSPVMDREYYRHGLSYDQGEAAEQRAVSLGWKTVTTRHGDHLSVRLTDAAELPVAGGHGRLLISRLADRTFQTSELLLSENSPGIYEVRLPQIPAEGLTLSLVLAKGDASLSRRFLIQQAANPSPR